MLKERQSLVMRIFGALFVAAVFLSALSAALEDDVPGNHGSNRQDMHPYRSSIQASSASSGDFMMMDAAEEMDMYGADDGSEAAAAPPPPPMAHSRMAKTSARSAGPEVMMAASAAVSNNFGGGGGGSGSRMSLGAELLSSAPDSSFDASSVEKMLVRNGNMDIEAQPDKLESIADGAVAAVTKVGGFCSDRNTYRNKIGWGKRKGESQVNIHMTLKVPVAEFFNVVEAVKGLVSKDELISSSDSVEDVTDQYVDVAARAKTLDSTRAQLVKLMEKANEVDQVLKIQRELSSVVQQLEAKKARMEVLKKSASLSTIRLNLRPKEEEPEPPKPRPGWSIFRTFRRALAWLGRMTTKVIDTGVFFLVGLVPICVVATLLYMCCGRGGGARVGSDRE